ncbi:MAG: DUF2058 domain-containing protein [Halofilum sp. (in: g-proteobacteria)]
MANSLQDQLMKAGLADEKRARELEKEKRAKAKRKQPKSKRGTGQQQQSERARQEQSQKAERDRQIEAKRQAKQKAKETAEQIRQIVANHHVDRAQGEAVYRFTQGSRIKEIQVTNAQRQQIARGELAVIGTRKGYELVPATIAERIRPLDESVIRVANERASGETDPEDPYADYPVPDDLMW